MRQTEELERYAEYLLKRELSEQTRGIYLEKTRKFLNYMEGRRITKEATIAYKKKLLKQEYRLSTINLHLTAVNSYLRFAGFADCIVKTQKQQTIQSPDQVLTVKDYQKLLAWAKESDRDKYYYIMRTLALTGIRISELSGCSVKALEQGKFVVRNKGKSREVFIPKKLATELKEYCRRENIVEGVIFRGHKEEPIGRISVYQMLAKLADELGMPKGKVHPHSFRHLFAITYMQHYSNLFELADLLGHSSLETTRIYTIATADEKRQRINRLNL